MTNVVHVKFFARLREELGVSSMDIPAEEVPDLDALIDWLGRAHPTWQPILQRPLMTAVNQSMTHLNHPLKAGDEVALFPPVTGG
ncbi:MoaD/ThiS family protein [Saccharospirillum impatiens]|uniref:MoaD/ThiS family protein n=1 Tax=Saccharospirillum impatiens TaxID=169438 RepID=UPI00048DE1CE|nr:MoaD/ThiS family protein [Saccharospirillum impatiens]